MKLSDRHRDRLLPARGTSRRGELAKLIGVPVALSLLGFGLGQWSERRKERVSADRASVESRRKVYVDTSAGFVAYVTNWSRLRTIAEEQKKMQAQATSHAATDAAMAAEAARFRALLAERKAQYVKNRDTARDTLLAHLEAAKIVFSKDVIMQIEAFEDFDQRNAQLSLAELRPIGEWRDHARGIFKAMQREIDGDGS